jgi:hypothetical protein
VVAFGALLAVWATRWLITVMHVEFPISRNLMLALEPEVTPAVVIAAASACLLSMLVVGLLPAWRSTSPDLRSPLGGDGATTPRNVGTHRRMVSAQVAGSVVLLLMVVSMAQTVTRASGTPGVDVDRLAIASVSFYLSPRDPIQAERLRADILSRVRQAPGVESVAASVGLPFGIYLDQGSVAASAAALQGNEPSGENAYVVLGTEELLPTLGISLAAGRSFSADEVRERRNVIVLSETTARAVFGTVDAVGRVVWFHRGYPITGTPVELTVVGVSRDTDVFTMGSRHAGAVFLPFEQETRSTVTFIARATGDPGAAVGLLRKAIREVDPGLVVDGAGTGWTMLGGPYFFLGALAWVSSALGGLTLVLVMTGLFGVISALVTQRNREFGIRMALGSTPSGLLRLVITQGLRPARDGLIVGLVLGVMSRLAIGMILPVGMTAVDPFAFAVVPVLVVIAAVASSLLPARRAARVDPNVALRTH